MKKFLEMLESASEENKEEKILKTVAMTPEQKKLWAEFKRTKTIVDKASEKASFAKQKFWNKIEGDLELFNNQMKVDSKKETVIVYEAK